MIEQAPMVLGGGVSILGGLAIWLWRLQRVAAWMRVGAILLGLTTVGAVLGIVDIARAVELIKTVAGGLPKP
jgi:hypothetical protein